MPVQLVAFRFEDWRDLAWDADYEPGGDFQRYLARTAWQEARRSWLYGEGPQNKIKVPRPEQRGSANTVPVPERGPAGNPPTLNRAPAQHSARPIKSR
ncbi:hypothetical protein [Streptomyces sp. NPDC058291]|uniref:hypothetical protein n=1 Tax=Streptomyces sp. NPDC058291 TaxID=3346427 RepID=UPI0036E89B76